MQTWIEKYKKIAILQRCDIAIFLQLFVVILLLKITIKLIPFAKFRLFYAFLLKHKFYKIYSENQVQQIVWSIKVIAAYMPFTVSCLPQALAAKYMLCYHVNMLLKIGVNRQNKAFVAHAWVEQDGQFIIGELPNQDFVPIWNWN